MGIRDTLMRALGAFVMTSVLFAAAMVIAHGLSIPDPARRFLPTADGAASEEGTDRLVFDTAGDSSMATSDDPPTPEVTAVPTPDTETGNSLRDDERAAAIGQGAAADDDGDDTATGDRGDDATGDRGDDTPAVTGQTTADTAPQSQQTPASTPTPSSPPSPTATPTPEGDPTPATPTPSPSPSSSSSRFEDDHDDDDDHDWRDGHRDGDRDGDRYDGDRRDDDDGWRFLWWNFGDGDRYDGDHP